MVCQEKKIDEKTIKGYGSAATDRHVVSLGHIILIPSETNLRSYSLLVSKTTNTNFEVFGLTRQGLEHTVYNTWGEHANYCITDPISFNISKQIITHKYNFIDNTIKLLFDIRNSNIITICQRNVGANSLQEKNPKKCALNSISTFLLL
jgi:hypothetical protein